MNSRARVDSKIFVIASALVAAISIAAASRASDSASPPNAEPIIAGLGATHYQITTKSPDAQRYFDQGLSLVYAFNHEEARKSFAQAAGDDPDCAMCFWGQALTLGPNYNLAEDPDREKTAYMAITKAKALEAPTTDKERALIDALATRYTAGGAMNLAQQITYS